MNLAPTPLLHATAAGRLCAALLAVGFIASSADAQTWTGKGSSTSWNDAANWDAPAAPLPVLSAEFVFDGPAGNAFGFGGKEAFRAAVLHFTPQAGKYSITAPEIVIGGSAAEDKTDGWILESIFSPGRVVNESPQAQTLNSDVRLGWDTTFFASNGNLVVNGKLDGTGFILEKTGPRDLIVNEGAADLARLVLKAGRLVLLGSSATFRDVGGQNPEAELVLLNGARLVSDRADAADPESPLAVFPSVSLSGVSKSTGQPCSWDLSGRPLRKYGGAFSLSHGAAITNAGALFLHTLGNQTNGVAYRVEGGASIHCKGLVIGATDKDRYRTARLVQMTVAGNRAPGARQTLLDLGGGSLNVGYRDEGNTRSWENSLTVTDGARIVNAGEFRVAGGQGDSGNAASFSNGASLVCQGMRVGLLGSSNRVDVAGAGTAVDLGEKPLYVGTVSTVGSPHGNSVRITDGAAVDRAGVVYVGRCTGWGESTDGDNVLTVDNGARLVSQGALIGCNDGRSKRSARNRVVIDGARTHWNASGDRLLIGNAGAGTSTVNLLLVANGAVVTNLGTIAVGVAAGGESVGNMLAITNGAQVFSRGAVQIGAVNRESKTLGATGNLILVSGGPMGPARWDIGGGALAVGAASAWNGISHGNRLVLQAGAQVINAGAVQIGPGRDGNFKDNQIVLAGGLIMAASLEVSERNGLGVELGPWESKPILVEKDVVFEHGTFIDPKAHPGAKPGRHPLLGWKGKAEGLDRLKLVSGAAKNSWKLEIQEDQKRIYLHYK